MLENIAKMLAEHRKEAEQPTGVTCPKLAENIKAISLAMGISSFIRDNIDEIDEIIFKMKDTYVPPFIQQGFNLLDKLEA